MIAAEKDVRNYLILRLLYMAGLRVSELCQLCWKDTVPRGETGQITVQGQGGKVRTILLPPTLWTQLQQLRVDATASDPVFRSKNGKPLDRIRVFRIVKAAASRAGINENVSPHWLRHAHASHSLDRGAPLHLTQRTLGHSRLGRPSAISTLDPMTALPCICLSDILLHRIEGIPLLKRFNLTFRNVCPTEFALALSLLTGDSEALLRLRSPLALPQASISESSSVSADRILCPG
jgi:integrase/recombinase XerD